MWSTTRRAIWRNASIDESDCPNVVAARLEAGEDPHAVWHDTPVGRRTCEELAELDPAALCAAVCLNSEAHPCLAALSGSRALKLAAKAQAGTSAGVAADLLGALRSWACARTSH
jgi:hypothetical protein